VDHELHAQTQSPISPGGGRSHTPNFSHPGAATASPTQNKHPHGNNDSVLGGGKIASLTAVARGIHGASEAFRGAVNENIAGVGGDEVEREIEESDNDKIEALGKLVKRK